MFGIDDLLLASLVGGGLGAVTNKKNPLKGALMGAALGGVGGGLLGGAGSAGAAASPYALAPGASLAEGATLGGAGSMFSGASLAPGATLGAAPAVSSGYFAGSQIPSLAANATQQSTPGLFGNLASFGEKAKPFTNMASTGMQAANMFKQPEQPLPTPPQVPVPVGGPQALAQLSGSLQQMGANTDQERMMREARRRQLLSQIGGGYGRSFG